MGMDIGALPPIDRNVEGIVEVMLDATRQHDEPLTPERLFGWHAALFPTGRSGIRRITVGAWRTKQSGPMQVVSGPIRREQVHYEAPDAGLLKKEMILGVMGRDAVLKLSAAWGSLAKHKPPVAATLDWLNDTSPKLVPPLDRLAIGGGMI